MAADGNPAGRINQVKTRRQCSLAYPFLLLFLLMGSIGCSFLDMQPLAITSWSPNRRVVSAGTAREISVTFSAKMNRVSAEEAFSMSCDGRPLSGRYHWNDTTLTFTPFGGIHDFRDYEFAVTTQAEDLAGNSLLNEFVYAFRTGSEGNRPRVKSVHPADGAVTTDRLQQIQIDFTQSMERGSVYTALSISPRIPLKYRWSMDDTRLTAVPAEQLAWQERYRVTLAETAANTKHNTLGNETAFEFRIGNDRLPPSLLFAGDAGDAGETRSFTRNSPDTIPPPAAGFETSMQISLRFSEPVHREELAQRIAFRPAWPHTLSPSDETYGSEFILTGEERFQYDRLYRLTLQKGILDAQGNGTEETVEYLFRTDSPRSAPPRVTILTFHDGSDFYELSAYDTIDLSPLGSGGYAFFDLYLELAEDAALKPEEAIEHFYISATNTAARIRPVRYESIPFDGPPPCSADPEHHAGVLRVHLWIENNEGASGTIYLKLTEGFTDTLGNPLEEDWSFSLNK